MFSAICIFQTEWLRIFQVPWHFATFSGSLKASTLFMLQHVLWSCSMHDLYFWWKTENDNSSLCRFRVAHCAMCENNSFCWAFLTFVPISGDRVSWNKVSRWWQITWTPHRMPDPNTYVALNHWIYAQNVTFWFQKLHPVSLWWQMTVLVMRKLTSYFMWIMPRFRNQHQDASLFLMLVD